MWLASEKVKLMKAKGGETLEMRAQAVQRKEASRNRTKRSLSMNEESWALELMVIQVLVKTIFKTHTLRD